MIRSFELRDVPVLHRYRQQGLFLDTVPALTWGRTLVPAGAVLSPFSSAMGVFTSICVEEDPENPLVGQVAHTAGAPYARFTFLAPDRVVESPALSSLLEELIVCVGQRGAHSLIAEVDENSHTFEALRRAGFSIYTRQRIWKISEQAPRNGRKTKWHKATTQNEFSVRTLYHSLVPALVQQVEPAPGSKIKGYVLFEDGELLAFADFAQGPAGLWVQPIVHPQVGQVKQKLKGLLDALPSHQLRPVYISVRSSQSWLEPALEDLGALAGTRQAVMVKRLAISKKMKDIVKLSAPIEGRPEITTPYSSINLYEEKS